MRLDGNSAFGDEFPFQAYPKVSAAYNISEEAFWPTNLVSSLKLRAAFGTAGRAPAQFAADRTFDPVASEDGQPAVTPLNVGDPNLGPETSHEFEFGVDAGIWDNRLGLELTYYNQRTKDALVQTPYPPP
jgi:outer membrane receptor protein involved in Fe transport